MAWFAYSDHEKDWQSQPGNVDDDLMSEGTLMVQLRANDCPNDATILRVSGQHPWHREISLVMNAQGRLELRLVYQGRPDSITENGFGNPTGAKDLLITYSWHAPTRSARLTVSDTTSFHGQTAAVDAPPPMFRSDLVRLAKQALAAPVEFAAVSDRPEPVGPLPGITLLTRIDTPDGPRPAGELTTGDLVHTNAGVFPILARANLTLPAAGVFAPSWLHAPFHGLRHSVSLARHQQLVFDGADVEYDLGQQNVLISAAQLTTELVPAAPDLITYCQFLLPEPAGLFAHGGCLASVNLGRMRRNRTDLALSLFGNLPEELLPDHGHSTTQPIPDHMFRMLADRQHF